MRISRKTASLSIVFLISLCLCLSHLIAEGAEETQQAEEARQAQEVQQAEEAWQAQEVQQAEEVQQAREVEEAQRTTQDAAAEEETPFLESLELLPEIFEPQQEDPHKVRTRVYSTKTEDGWTISINRYRQEGESEKKSKAAVILCHGFNINNKFWDLDRRCSLARYLARNGYDVWAPSLRGSGLSSKPVFSEVRSLVKFELKDLPKRLIRTPFDLTKLNWTIDDHIYEDVPAIIDFVKEKSGFHKVYWIGHSMGGIIMFGYLETVSQKDIAGFIPIGSMMVIPKPLSPHLKTIADQKPLLTASLIINTTVASQLRNLTFGAVKHPIEGLLFKRENVHDNVLSRFFRSCIDDTSAGVVTQFSDSIRKGEMLTEDRKFSYSGNLFRVKIPIMFMAGGADGFVTEAATREAYRKAYSLDKSIAILSKSYGYSTDYGHCDVILGKNSESEVYPVILRWLDERTGI